jgi:hypothetical protein
MLNGGGHANRLQLKATVNRAFYEGGWPTATINILTKVGSLKQPPPLIYINIGGCPNGTASFNDTSEMVI